MNTQYIIKFNDNCFYARLNSNDIIELTDNTNDALKLSAEGIRQEQGSGRLDHIEYSIIIKQID
jgi:hypothetical protein